jgi:hypothetical protein
MRGTAMNQHRTAQAPSYEADFYAWTQRQAKLLRALGRIRSDLPAELDVDHVAEEIEDLGKAELRGTTHLIRQIFVHLLTAASEKESRAQAHWRTETLAFQADLPKFYTPSMRRLIDMDAIWKKALEIADSGLREHGGSLAPGLPEHCPYALAEIVADDFSFDEALKRLRSACKPS